MKFLSLLFALLLVFLNVGCTTETAYSEPTACDIELSQTKDKLKEAENALYLHREALVEANHRIMEASSNSWEDYDTMGDILDNLQPVDDPPQP